MHIVDGSPIGTSGCRGNDAGTATTPDRRIPDEEHAAVGPPIDNTLCCHAIDHHVLEEDRGRGLNDDALGSCNSETVAGNAANFDGLRGMVCQACRQIDLDAAEDGLNQSRGLTTVDCYRLVDDSYPEGARIDTPDFAIDLGFPEGVRNARARVSTGAGTVVIAGPRDPTDRVQGMSRR